MIETMTRPLARAAVLTLAVLAMLAPAAAQPRPGVAAPELSGGPWINSRPLALGDLRGRVVLVEFWTYG
jgi:hypothetical protein